MNISICIITGNEAEKLNKCLEALKPLTGQSSVELVVTDTGSTDDTRKVALAHGAQVFDFAWRDDFSAARNFTAKKASNDMIFMLDTDEYLLPQQDMRESQTANFRFPELPRGQVGRILRINLLERDGELRKNREYINRIYDRRFFHYEGRIHEQLVRQKEQPDHMATVHGEQQQNTGTLQCTETVQQDKLTTGYETYISGFAVLHDGYNGTLEERRRKAERNLILLLAELEEAPEDTYLLYQIGKSYYMAGNYPQAVKYFELALGYELEPKLEYVIDMVETYGYALLKTGQVETALNFEGIYDEFCGTADFQFLMGLIYMNNEYFDRAVAEFEKATRHTTARTEGVNSYLAWYNAGVIKECLGEVAQAKKYYSRCGDYGKARERLQKLQ